MLGQWKNYEELEASLCYDELLVTLNAMREKERRDRIFLAALQGVDLEEELGIESKESVREDITTLSGYAAAQEGFGIGFGLGFMEVDDDING